MKKNRRKILFIAFLSLLFFVLAISFSNRIKTRIVYCYKIIKDWRKIGGTAKCQGCETLFNDGIKAHEKAYQNEGIAVQHTDAGLFKLEQRSVLENIESNDWYIVRDFNHSQPMLLPKAILYLNKLSISYKQKCIANHTKYVRFDITSATRSIKSVNELSKENPNAIMNSAHLRGKTFDISYGAFSGYTKQLKLFIEALSELKNQKKCFVKYERNGCLHITVN